MAAPPPDFEFQHSTRSESDLAEAYRAGRDAQIAGSGLTMNPWPTYDARYNEWRTGWYYSQQNNEQARMRERVTPNVGAVQLAGSDAYRLNAAFADNPYTAGSMNSHLWGVGWLHAADMHNLNTELAQVRAYVKPTTPPTEPSTPAPYKPPERRRIRVGVVRAINCKQDDE